MGLPGQNPQEGTLEGNHIEGTHRMWPPVIHTLEWIPCRDPNVWDTLDGLPAGDQLGDPHQGTRWTPRREQIHLVLVFLEENPMSEHLDKTSWSNHWRDHLM
jgi:hypothetical protein